MTSVTAPLHRFRRWVSMVADQVAAVADAVRAVNRDALVAVLFDQEGTHLVRMARLFTDDRNAAEDIVQEAFIRLHRAAHRLKDPEKAAPYLRSIVVNLARDHNRRGLMSLRHQEAMVSDAVSELPEDLAIANDDHRKIVIELRELSPRQRDCLLLRYYMDLTEVEIADVLGISSNSVKTHCQRGMSALRGPGGGDAMTFEQQVEGALHSADLFQPSPDLFAKVKRSIGEDLAHRSRVRRVLGAVAASVAAVLVYLFVTVDVTSGAWSMSFTALEVLVTVIMIGIVIVLGPAIRRFGETFERDIFRGSPETGTGMLKLLDMSYYLIFGAFILMTVVYRPSVVEAETMAEWLDFEILFRIGGLMLLIGMLHVALVTALPVVGLIFSANRRRERITAGGESNDPGMDKVDLAITVGSWIIGILLGIWVLQLIVGLTLGVSG